MRIPVIAVALVLLTGVATAWAGSTINPTVPAQNSPLSSAPVRSNFLAAYNDVNGIEGMFAGSSAPLNPTQGQDWLNTTTITAAAWSKWSAQSGTWIELGVFNLVSGTFAPVFSTASFAATPPLAVTSPSGVVTYALNYGASLAVSGSPSSLVVNMANANAWSVLQTFNGGATVTGSFTATGLVTNADLANSTISGIALGSNLDTLTFGTHLAAGGTSYNGSAGVTITSDATNANTASTIVARDGSGNFSAGTITASLTGHASLDLALTGGMLSGLTSVDLGSGTGAPAADTGTGLAVYGADATTSRMETTAFGATAAVSLRSSLGTRGSPSALTAGTLIASYNVHGYDGSIWTSTAYGAVHTYAQANWTSTSHETKICFATTPTTSSATNADSLCQYGDGSVSITTASATAFAVGLNGATNPALNVDASTASQVAGLDVVGAVHNGTVAVKVIDSSGSTNLTINALGSGTIGIGNVSTGAVTITPATTIVGNLTVNVTGSGQCLQASSVGVVSGTGSPCGGSGSTPGGSNTQVQYNNSSIFGGISGVTSNGTSMTFANGDLLLAGSSSGVMTLEAPAAASTYVMTFPAATDTVAVLGTAQTFTAAKTFSNQISSTAALTVASASGATLDDVNVASETTTLTGTTTVTALSKSHFYRPTFTDSSAATLTTASTVTIDNSPNCTGSLTCTNQWALNVVAGATNLGGTLNVESNALVREIANAGTTGTTVNELAKLTGAPSTAVVTATSDTGGAVGIVVSGAGTSGNAKIATAGIAPCAFDGATVAGDYVQISSSVGGKCADAGSTYPTTGQILGRVLATLGSAGNANVDLFGAGAVGSSGTVTNATINTAGGLTNTGTCSISTAGTCTIYSPGGYLNKFRNGTFDVWQRGTGATSIGTSGNYFADGWKVYFTGSTGVTALQAAGPSAGYPLYSLEIEGATSNTDIKVGQRIESYVAAPLAGQTVTVQFWYYQNTGSTVTPKFSTCYASAQDNFGTCTGDVSSTSLTACATATWCQEAYTFTASSSAANGYEIDLDCNAGFTSISVNCRFAAADIRVTPGVSTGVNTNPPPPELRPIATEMAFNQRYYQVSYYTTDPTSTSIAIDFVSGFLSGNAAFFTLKFAVPMRAAPTFTLAAGGSWENETPVIETQVQQVLMGNASGFFYAQGTLGAVSGAASAEL